MQRQLKLDKVKHVFLKGIPSQPLQEVFIRLDKSFSKFFDAQDVLMQTLRQDVANLVCFIPPRYPKIKKYKDYNSMTFPQFGFKKGSNHRYAASFSQNGKLRLSKLGEIAINMHREVDGPIKQLIVKRQGNRWYAIFWQQRKYSFCISATKASPKG